MIGRNRLAALDQLQQSAALDQLQPAPTPRAGACRPGAALDQVQQSAALDQRQPAHTPRIGACRPGDASVASRSQMSEHVPVPPSAPRRTSRRSPTSKEALAGLNGPSKHSGHARLQGRDPEKFKVPHIVAANVPGPCKVPHILASNVPGPPVAISAMAPAGPPWDLKRGRTINGKNEYDILVEGSAAEGCRQAGISSVVIAAPDCSTSSRAREIKIPGVRCRQLRSTEFPEGFNTELNEKEYGRIKDANDIAAWTAQVCAMALEDGRGLMVENPFRSYLWGLPAFKKLAADPTVRLVRCDSCMQGSLQFKPTGFLTNLPDAERLLGLQCQGGRSGPCTQTGVYHEAWDPI